jgi:hypothetical protein
MSHFNLCVKIVGRKSRLNLAFAKWISRDRTCLLAFWFKPSRLVVRAASRGAPTKLLKRSAAMPDHKVKISISRDRKPWWRSWNDYPNPTLDAVLALFVIAVLVMVCWFLMMK